jgi:hypothetical protein
LGVLVGLCKRHRRPLKRFLNYVVANAIPLLSPDGWVSSLRSNLSRFSEASAFDGRLKMAGLTLRRAILGFKMKKNAVLHKSGFYG